MGQRGWKGSHRGSERRGWFRRGARGQALVEYALIIALTAIGLMGILTIFGKAVGSQFQDVVNSLGVNQTWTPIPIGVLPATRTAQAQTTVPPRTSTPLTPTVDVVATGEAIARTQTVAAQATASARPTDTVQPSNTPVPPATAIPTIPTFTGDIPYNCTVLDRSVIYSCVADRPYWERPLILSIRFTGPNDTTYEVWDPQSGIRQTITHTTGSVESKIEIETGRAAGTVVIYQNGTMVARYPYLPAHD